MKFLTGFESFVGVNFWTCLFTFANLIILYLFLKKLLFKPVKDMIDSRQKEIDDLYADANRSKTDAQQLKTEYEGRLAAANAESEEILKVANRKAQLRQEQILKEARDQAAQTLRRADEQIEMEKKRAMNEIKDDVSVMAVDIASAVLARNIKREEQSELIDSFIEKLGEKHD